MKKLIFGLILTGATALAAITDVDRAEQPFKSILKDSGFETGKAAWVASGGTFSIVTSGSNLLAGKSSATWDSSAAAQTLTSTAVAIPKGLYGQNGEAICTIQTPSGTATHLLEVYDGSNVVASVTVTSSVGPSKSNVNFVYPTSGNVQLRLKSVASNEPLVAVDDCYLGLATNISTTKQLQFVGSAYFAQTTNCSWSRTNTAIGAFGTDTDCPGPTIDIQRIGSWQTTDADLPQVTINDLPEGLYKVTATGSLYGGGDWTMAISDGTNTRGYASGSGNGAGTFQPANVSTAWFEYSTSGNRTFAIHGSSSSGAISLDNNQNNDRTTFVIERYDRFPSTYATINNTDYGWTAYTPTFTGFGTVTGINCYYKRQSEELLVRCTFVPGTTTATIAKVDFPTGLTSSSSIPTLELAGTAVINVTTNGYSSVLREPSVTYFTFGRDTGSATAYQKYNGSTWVVSGNTVSFLASVPIQGWVATQKTPVFVGSVTSASTGAEKIERAKVNCDASSSITSQSGSWVSSIGNRSTTSCALTLASGFSAAPTCVFTINSATVNATSVQVSSATAVTVYGPNADYDGELLCMGAK